MMGTKRKARSSSACRGCAAPSSLARLAAAVLATALAAGSVRAENTDQREALEPRADTSAAAPAVPPAAAAAAPAPAVSGVPAAPASSAKSAAAGYKAATPTKQGVAGQHAAATDHVDLDTTTVTGNQELPRVMYIVPWKKSDIGDLAGKPPGSLLDEVLAPVDRDVFRREVRYYDAVKAQSPGGSAPADASGPQVEK
jgi:hypothetical protein